MSMWDEIKRLSTLEKIGYVALTAVITRVAIALSWALWAVAR